MNEDLPIIRDGEDKSSPLKNCLRNHYRHVRKWAKRTDCTAFRLYDREIAHYPFAIDFYAGRYLVHYFSPTRDEEEVPIALKQEIETLLSELFGMQRDAIFWRTRIRREKREQYEKIGGSKDYFTVREHGALFWVNLVDYLDTGLFLDHRTTRALVAKAAKGKSLLNLFSYTGAFSIQVALGGAVRTKSVDMSNTYSDWCRENLKLNNLSLTSNEVVRADCLKFLDDEFMTKNRYDLIVIDPPTLSRSKKMEQMFDIQRDHGMVIRKALKLLNTGGVIYFSTNSRRFKLDEFDECEVHDITAKTLPLDFHDPHIHKAWTFKW